MAILLKGNRKIYFPFWRWKSINAHTCVLTWTSSLHFWVHPCQVHRDWWALSNIHISASFQASHLQQCCESPFSARPAVPHNIVVNKTVTTMAFTELCSRDPLAFYSDCNFSLCCVLPICLAASEETHEQEFHSQFCTACIYHTSWNKSRLTWFIKKHEVQL